MARTKERVAESSSEARDRLTEILDAAAELFYKQGYHATTVQDVADQVGMLKGSLYYYIKSKEDLLYATLEQVITRGDDYLVHKLAGSKNPVDKLRLAMEAEIEYIIQNQVTVGLFLHEFHVLSSQRRRRILAKMRQFENRIVAIIEEGQAAGQFIDVNPRLAVYGILGMCNWIYRWYRRSRGMSLNEIKSVFTRIVLEGMVKA